MWELFSFLVLFSLLTKANSWAKSHNCLGNGAFPCICAFSARLERTHHRLLWADHISGVSWVLHTLWLSCIFQVVNTLGSSGNFTGCFFCFWQGLYHLFWFICSSCLLFSATSNSLEMQDVSFTLILELQVLHKKREMSEVNERQFFLRPLRKLKIWPFQEMYRKTAESLIKSVKLNDLQSHNCSSSGWTHEDYSGASLSCAICKHSLPFSLWITP